MEKRVFLFVIGVMEIYGCITGSYNRICGILLLIAFIVYACLNVRLSSGEEDGEETESAEDVSIPKQLLILAVCAALLYAGANLLVDNGILIAQALGVPERVIAVTFIALGTSLPELVTSLMSLIKGYGNVGLGNVIGANILNLLLVIGIPAAVEGIPLERQTLMVDIPLAISVMAVLLAPILIRKNPRACRESSCWGFTWYIVSYPFYNPVRESGKRSSRAVCAGGSLRTTGK